MSSAYFTLPSFGSGLSSPRRTNGPGGGSPGQASQMIVRHGRERSHGSSPRMIKRTRSLPTSLPPLQKLQRLPPLQKLQNVLARARARGLSVLCSFSPLFPPALGRRLRTAAEWDHPRDSHDDGSSRPPLSSK